VYRRSRATSGYLWGLRDDLSGAHELPTASVVHITLAAHESARALPTHQSLNRAPGRGRAFAGQRPSDLLPPDDAALTWP